MTPNQQSPSLPPDIEWFYFDLDDTLWDHVAAREHAAAWICGLLDLDRSLFTQHYKHQTIEVLKEVAAGRLDIASSRVVRMRGILAALEREIEHEHLVPLAAEYLERYLRYNGCIDSAREVIDATSRVARVAILTNASHETQDPKIAQLGGPELFDIIVTTDETGEVLKPDPRFFDVADRLAGNPDPARVVMVGDAWEHDIEHAHERGYWCVWISPEEDLPEPLERVLRIAHIRELLPLLAGREAAPLRRVQQ